MAAGEPNLDNDQMSPETLKYLGFVQAATFRALMCFSNLYVYAKNKSGLLKPGLESVETTVKTVVGPVYDKYHDVPVELLKFMDRKVDESFTKVDIRVQQVSGQAISVAQRAPEVAIVVASELYTKYEPVAETCALSAWKRLNRLPVFPHVAQVVIIPTAAYLSDKYNVAVQSGAQNGYRAANYLPLLPTERIAKVFSF